MAQIRLRPPPAEGTAILRSLCSILIGQLLSSVQTTLLVDLDDADDAGDTRGQICHVQQQQHACPCSQASVKRMASRAACALPCVADLRYIDVGERDGDARLRAYALNSCDSVRSVVHYALCVLAESAGDFETDFGSGLQEAQCIGTQ